MRRTLTLSGLGMFLILAVTALGLVPSAALGAVPKLINFQGVVKDSAGNTPAVDMLSVSFTIYDDPLGGSALWTETQSITIADEGRFNVLLGSSNPIPDSVFADTVRFLGIKVDTDPEMLPRQQLVSVAYSFRVAHFIPDFGPFNTFIGRDAGNLTTSGAGNTASGALALQSNTTGGSNTATGVFALQSNTIGSSNTASGAGALLFNISGDLNTASGANALRNNTTGFQNTASGYNALRSNTTGGNNTASGFGALFGNTTGTLNTASGVQALQGNTAGGSNTASGASALRDNSTGFQNTANGASALLFNTTGFSNTASGVSALAGNATGRGNTASGVGALASNTTGDSNTAVGAGANVSAGDLTNATAIGAGAIVDASNKIRLGNSFVTVIEGQVAYTFTSDKSEKENFRQVDGEEVLRKIREFNLSSWNYIGHDPKKFRHYGPMAQDFFAAFGDDGVGTIGTPTTLNTGDVVGILMAAVQALEKRTTEIADLKVRLEVLENGMKKLIEEKMASK